MSQPAYVGKNVLYNMKSSVQSLPAVVVEIPLWLIGGSPNDDGAGNPQLVTLSVHSTAGPFAAYGIRYSEEFAPGTWSEIQTTP